MWLFEVVAFSFVLQPSDVNSPSNTLNFMISPSRVISLLVLCFSISAHSYMVHPARQISFRSCGRMKCRRESAMPASNLSRENINNFPRAAVSVVIRWSDGGNVPIPTKKYLLVQRGKNPNKGMWSLPGGKIEFGESTLDAAKRELWEETGVSSLPNSTLRWYAGGPFACSDSIHNQSTGESFHYVISQCFAVIQSSIPPNVKASDDAKDAGWWNESEIKDAEVTGLVTKGVSRVIERSEELHRSCLLECEE